MGSIFIFLKNSTIKLKCLTYMVRKKLLTCIMTKIPAWFVCHVFLRYLNWFGVYLTNLESADPGAMCLIDIGVLGATRTLIPGLLCDIHRTKEEIFMKFAKGSVTFVSPTLVMIYFHWYLINLRIFTGYQFTLHLYIEISNNSQGIKLHNGPTIVNYA